jgi:hypothetical protein
MAGGKNKGVAEAVQPSLFVVATTVPEGRGLGVDGKPEKKSRPARASRAEHLQMEQNKGEGRTTLIVLPDVK